MCDSCNVEQKGFSIGWRNQDQGLRQKMFDRVKCFLGLGRPFKVVGLLQESIKGESSFTEAPSNSLYPLHVLN